MKNFVPLYKKEIIGILFLLIIIPIFLKCVSQSNPKEFYWATSWKFQQELSNKPFSISHTLYSIKTGFNHSIDILIFRKKHYLPSERPIAGVFLDIYGLCMRLMDKSYIDGNTMIRMNNGQLTFLYPLIEDSALNTYTNSVNKLNTFLRQKNIPLLFIMFPFKVHHIDTQLPSVIKDFTNKNADNFMKKLQEKNILCIDTRKLLELQPEKHYQLFYYGDHHWKPEYAYLTYMYISKNLNEQKSPLASFFDSKQMELNYYSRITKEFLRPVFSQERRVGNYYLTCHETATYLIPKQRTLYTYQKENYRIEGSLEDTFLYKYGDEPVERIINNDTQKETKILLIHDSFSMEFRQFLCTNNYQVDLIDPRFYHKSIKEYIENNKPDVVIWAINPDQISMDVTL